MLDKLKKRHLKIDWLMVALFGFCVFLTLIYNVIGNDYWWHVKVGEWIVQNKAVPTTTIFNWYDSTKPWTAHEWLFEAFIYGLTSLFGYKGVWIFVKLMSILILGLILKVSYKYKNKSPIMYSFFIILMALNMTPNYIPRPQMFSMFFILAVMEILHRYEDNEDTKLIYLMPVISVLWSNIHGGYALLGYLLPCVLLFSHLMNFRAGRLISTKWSKKKLIKLGLITISVILAMLINPLGIKVLTYPFSHFGDSVQANNISEWRTPSAQSVTDIIYLFLPMLLVLVCMIWSKKELKFSHFMLCLVTMFLTFRSVRFLKLFMLCAIYFGLPYIDVFKPKRGWKSKRKPLACYCLLAFFASSCILVDNLMKNSDELIGQTLPEETYETIDKYEHERMYNSYDFGGELIAHGYDVYFDPRADCYVSEENALFQDSIDLNSWTVKCNGLSGAEYPEEIIEFYDFDSFLLDRKNALYFHLLESDEFELKEVIYQPVVEEKVLGEQEEKEPVELAYFFAKK